MSSKSAVHLEGGKLDVFDIEQGDEVARVVVYPPYYSLMIC